MFGVEIRGDVTKRRKSSANRAHLCSWGPHITPLISGWVLIATAKVSMAMANIRGESGQSCLVPFFMLKGSKYLPCGLT